MKNLPKIIFLLCSAFILTWTLRTSVCAAGKYTVRIYDNSGKTVQKTYKVTKGKKLTLPSIYESNSKILLGFSQKKKQHSSPSYYVGQTITVNKNLKLYNVDFYPKNEKNLSASSLLDISDVPYENVIFVGDSRTYYTFERELTKSKYPALHNHIYHIALSGSGLSYLKNTAYPELETLLSKLDRQKTAIVFNHGVNDLDNINSYISFMRQIASSLKEQNCSLFYMSVNPMSVANRTHWNKLIYRYISLMEKRRKESKLLAFNQKIKKMLCTNGGSYTYIDTFSYLTKYGFSYHYKTAQATYNDGLHYTAKTEKRIYQYVMNFLAKH